MMTESSTSWIKVCAIYATMATSPIDTIQLGNVSLGNHPVE